MTHFVTEVSINSKCLVKKLKSSRTCLIGYLGFISREWFLIALGVDTKTDRHTTHTHVIAISRTKAISSNQVCTWFKNITNLNIHKYDRPPITQLCMYGRDQKRECFVIVLQTLLQYFVVKLQCVLCKITNCAFYTK